MLKFPGRGCFHQLAEGESIYYLFVKVLPAPSEQSPEGPHMCLLDTGTFWCVAGYGSSAVLPATVSSFHFRTSPCNFFLFQLKTMQMVLSTANSSHTGAKCACFRACTCTSQCLPEMQTLAPGPHKLQHVGIKAYSSRAELESGKGAKATAAVDQPKQ